MTTDLRTMAVRTRMAAALTTRRVTLRLLARSGDPVAAVLALRPRDDAYALYERIRARGPVVTSRVGVHAVTSRALCDQVLRDSRFRVRDQDGQPLGNNRATADASGPLQGSFLELDPPDHTRLRRLVTPTFRPKLIRAYADRAEAVAHRLLDGQAERDTFDLIADFAAPFPITVISDLLGIPDVDSARFARFGVLVGQSLDGVRSLREADALGQASDELAALFTRLAQERRANPSDDVISMLAAAQSDATMTARELVSTCGLLLLAGFETTVNLIGNGVAALLADRTNWDQLVADPSLAPRVVEETLRYDPSVQATARPTRTSTWAAGRCPQVRSSCRSAPPRTATRRSIAIRPGSTSRARGSPSTCHSPAASTTAWVHPSPGSRGRSPSASWPSACPSHKSPLAPAAGAAAPSAATAPSRSPAGRREPPRQAANRRD